MAGSKAAGRRLLHHQSIPHPHLLRQARQLQQAPATPGTAVSSKLSHVSSPQTLKEMLCEVSSWSPRGVESMRIDGEAVQGRAAEQSHLPGSVPLNAVIPLMFHFPQFPDADGYLQPAASSGNGATTTDWAHELIIW